MSSWFEPTARCREPGCATFVVGDDRCHPHILLREGWQLLADGRWRRPKDNGKTYTLKGAWRKRRGAYW